MDKVFIEGLKVDTLIGAYDWERGIRQCLVLDLVLAWDIRPAAQKDDLDLALDYARVAQSAQRFAEAASFHLLESFAESLADKLLVEFSVAWLRLKVGKPGAVAGARVVGVEIERSRAG